MTEKEFVYWLRGIMDSTEFMPTKKTWDTIQDKLSDSYKRSCFNRVKKLTYHSI